MVGKWRDRRVTRQQVYRGANAGIKSSRSPLSMGIAMLKSREEMKGADEVSCENKEEPRVGARFQLLLIFLA